MSELLVIRHLEHSVFHCPIELKGAPLKAAREADMVFDDHTDVCRIVFGDKNDDERPHDPPYVYTPDPAMPPIVWKTLLESKQYGPTLTAMVKKGALIPTRKY